MANDPFAARSKDYNDAVPIKQLPDGKYQAKIDTGVVGIAQSGKSIGNTYLRIGMIVFTGKYKGAKVSKLYDIDKISETKDGPKRIGIANLKGDFETLGVSQLINPLSTPNVKRALQAIKGSLCDIAIVTRNGYRNIYINDVVSSAPEATDDDLVEAQPKPKPKQPSNSKEDSDMVTADEVDVSEILEEFSS